MNTRRTMLGGRRYKVIREDIDYAHGCEGDFQAHEAGDDLVVSPRVFDAFEDVARAMNVSHTALSKAVAMERRKEQR